MLHSLASELRLLTSSTVSAAVHHPLPTVVSITCGLLAYYYLKVVSVPELVSKPTSAWTSFLRRHVPLLREKYWCSVWCYEGRVQTMAASLLGAVAPALLYDREILPLWDGGQICLDWMVRPPAGGAAETSDFVTSNGVPFGAPAGGVSAPEDDQPTDTTQGPAPSDTGPTGCHITPADLDPSCGGEPPAGGANLSPTDTQFPITDAPILIILPGLTGSSDSEYVKDFVRAGHAAGFKCVVMNNRGKGGVPLKTPRTYCAANCEDFAATVEHIVERYHRERSAALRQTHTRDHATAPVYSRSDPMIVVVGISLGGMILCHYLCECSAVAKQRLTAAVGVSVPYNVFIGTDNLERPLLNYLLNNHLARCLSRSVQDLAPMLADSDVWDYDQVVKASTIREFDSRFTARQFGFADVNAYYETASLHDKMHAVTVPYLGLSSLDDPFQPEEGLPLHTARTSDHVALCVTSHGGHIGFLEGVRGGRWGARLLLQLLTAVRSFPHLLQEGCTPQEGPLFQEDPLLQEGRAPRDGPPSERDHDATHQAT